MKFRLFLPLVLLSMASSLCAFEFFGFQTINVLNLKDNTKCSGVLINTELGCHAVTSAHCVRGLAIGEENIIISKTTQPEIHSQHGRTLYSKIVYSSNNDHRSYLIKAKPSSDLAQIYFNKSWAPKFCQDKYKLTTENTQRNLHINEVYTHQQQNQPGPVNQHLPGSMGQTHSPNPTIYYRPSQNYLLIASGFQNDLATLLSISPMSFDSFSDLKDKMKSRLNVEYSALPGFEFGYQVKGINLSQGMSGGALFEVDQEEIKFKGVSASFYPFQWKSNFIPASYVLDFLNNYQDDLSDQFEISINNNVQVAADNVSLKEEDKILRLKEEGKIPTVVVVKKPRHNIRQQNGPLRIPRTQVRFGDTDQDDVGGDVSLNCNAVTSEIDPFFDVLPPVTNCFDLSQTRFQHTGVIAKEFQNRIIIAYQGDQINGLADLKAIQARDDYDQTQLVSRPVGGYPSLVIRKDILKNFEGIYFEEENSAVTNQAMHRYAHLGEGFTKQYVINPSSNALIRESVINETELYGELFENLFNYNISNNIEQAHKVNLKLKVSAQSIKLGLKLTNQENYSFDMTPVFDPEFKKLTLKTSLTIYDSQFKRLSNESFELECDNRSFLKLICFNDKMELGLSASTAGASPSIRVAFWDGFKTKLEALQDQKLKMLYTFGELEKRTSIIRRVDLGLEFDGLKLKKLLTNENFVDIPQDEIMSFINILPNKVKAKLQGELTIKSFFRHDELFHVVYDGKKKYGVLFDRSFKVVAVILKGKFSSSAYDIF
ncbi:MAG: hypothetical protein ACN6I6_00935 [bacterium]